jgi:hypothetical protein
MTTTMGCNGHNDDDTVATDNVKHPCILEGILLKYEVWTYICSFTFHGFIICLRMA